MAGAGATAFLAAVLVAAAAAALPPSAGLRRGEMVHLQGPLSPAGHGGVSPELLPLAAGKRQVPTGADPIHHNERPPSLPHRHLVP